MAISISRVGQSSPKYHHHHHYIIPYISSPLHNPIHIIIIIIIITVTTTITRYLKRWRNRYVEIKDGIITTYKVSKQQQQQQLLLLLPLLHVQDINLLTLSTPSLFRMIARQQWLDHSLCTDIVISGNSTINTIITINQYW